MREILFRGKPKYDGEYYFFSQIWKDNCKDGFVCGSLVVDADRYYICVSAMRNINTCINNGMTSMIEVIPETVGQFTGLADKNGKKIFEGDICKDKRDKLWEVKFGEYTDCSDGMQVGFYYSRQRKYANGSVGEECFCMLCSTYKPESFEVIGNIHDNPELLENP